MQNRPFFSIVTPSFNSVSTIEDTLSSVLKQEFKDYEYVVVDGGSTDGTTDILRKYELLFDGRMRWKSEPDSGIYNAFNKGCKQAIGKYVWIVNSDDYITPNALNVIYQQILFLPLTLVIGGTNFISIDGKLLNTRIVTQKDIVTAYKKDWMVPHPAMLIPKEFYENYGYYDESFRVVADKDLFHRYYKKGLRFFIIDKPITNMRDGGISSEINYSRERKERLQFLKNKYGYGISYICGVVMWNIRFIKQNYLERKR